METNYNSILYWEMNRMQLDEIIAEYAPCNQYVVDSSVSGYLYYPKKEPFFISPDFLEINTEMDIDAEKAKFILFSAPGATGKTTLAKYISYKLNALYWDLSQLRLGTNSFTGSIVKAVTAVKYSSFIQDLGAARALLTIDAFDEAEIISGRPMIRSFLEDISLNLLDYTKAPVILFARTESAQYIASHFYDQGIAFKHYEIGYFKEVQAKEFVKKSVESVEKGITPADEKCINQYFDLLKNSISTSEQTSFLGYAPVLQAISRQILQEKNRAKLINIISSSHGCASIVLSIMDRLIDREQTEKVKEAFYRKCSESHPEFSEWNKVYSKKEQLVRLIHYILFNDCKYNYYVLDFLPPQLVDEYQEILDSFLKQHPFLRDYSTSKGDGLIIDFTGPAFRDYTLASLLVLGCEDEVKLYFDEFHNQYGGLYIPSRIFFDCYTEMKNGEINISHLFYLFESFRSKATALERPYLQCTELETENSQEKYVLSIFGMGHTGNTAQPEEITLNGTIDTEALVLENIVNISLDVPDIDVIVKSKTASSSIRNAFISCRRIIWNSEHVSIESYDEEECVLSCTQNATGNVPRFEIIGKGIKVEIPNITEYYRLIPYYYGFSESTSIDITKFAYALRRILVEFRTDKKDTLGKNMEKIDNITVGNNIFRKEVLQYLKYKNIIYTSEYENQYKINLESMREAGISYSAVSQMLIPHLKTAYDDFCSWKGQ